MRASRFNKINIGIVLFVAILSAIGCSNTEGPTSPKARVGRAPVPTENVPPNAPVIFLHYDYMLRSPLLVNSLDTTTTTAPDPETIALVVKAFRKHGITLIIDPQHTEIPVTAWLSFTPNGFGCSVPGLQARPVGFYDLKEQYFHPKGNQPWHYVIFAERGCTYYGQVGGASELPGYNFMVSVVLPHRTCFSGDAFDHCRLRQAAMFMHELGHNLDLHHGGDDEENYKPNYVSVMNYVFPWGISFSAPGDPLHLAGFRLDYSNGALPALDELHLDEEVGLGGPSGGTDLTVYRSSKECGDYSGFNTIRVANGPVDWNQNGIIENDVAVDINWLWTSNFTDPDGWGFLCPLFNSESSGLPLHDFDDWTHVQSFMRTPRYVNGTLKPLRVVSDSL